MMLDRPAIVLAGNTRLLAEYGLPALTVLLGVHQAAQAPLVSVNGALSAAVVAVAVAGLVRARRWLRDYPSLASPR